MRSWISSAIVMTLVLAATSPATLGQDGGNAGVGKSENVGADEARGSTGETEAESTELGIIGLRRIAKAGKYAFVFFHRGNDERTQTMRAALESGVAEIPDQAEVVAIDVTDPLEKATVNKFGVSRAPMPLILAVAPTGAITKSWFRNFDAKQLEPAFVSPCEAECLKALQDRKVVFVCIQNQATRHNAEALHGIQQFKADKAYSKTTEIVMLDPRDTAEADFLRKLDVDSEPPEAITVMLAPPGKPIGTFTGPTDKSTLVATAKKAAAGCDPKSGCCPPKKKPAKKKP